MKDRLVLLLFLVTILANQCNAADDDNNQELPKGPLFQLGLLKNAKASFDSLHENDSSFTNILWTRYVSQRKPIILKELADLFPAKDIWTDNFITSYYRNYNVDFGINQATEEIPNGQKHLKRQSLDKFISTYIQDHKYIDSQLPQPMQRDIVLHPYLSCGSLGKSMIDVHFWLNSGIHRSKLRKDAGKSTFNSITLQR